MQFFFMIPNLLFGKAIGITSGAIARKVGADTWTSMLIGFIIGIGVMALLTYLCFKFPDKTIINYSEDILGK
jgi:spore germination protein KB